MLKNKDFLGFKILRRCIYHANKCLNANDCWHFNIYEHDKFNAQLILVLQKYLVLTESKIPLKTVLGDVRIVALSISFHEQTQ